LCIGYIEIDGYIPALVLFMEHRDPGRMTSGIITKTFLTRKSSGGHKAKRRKEKKTEARGTETHATASALLS
jgi:hypothetical protein